jgi:pterin-4a-carbinolamine dehydratase
MSNEVSHDPRVFISYRRQDSSAAARWLYQTIQRTFGPSKVFMDTEAIRIGADWAESIEKALRATTILVAVIGRDWLRIADEYGQRRLDKEDDWVRNEIRHALESGTHLIPVLLSGTAIPKPKALPLCLQNLPRHQSFELRDDRWENDLAFMISKLEEIGLKKLEGSKVRYPTPRVSLKELSGFQIDAAIAALPGWQIAVSEIPGRAPLKRTEFEKTFEFKSFEEAIQFMQEAARHISQVQHHPRWENIWRAVTISLSTWDIGHKPSKLDIELAQYLNKLYESSLPPVKKSIS